MLELYKEIPRWVAMKMVITIEELTSKDKRWIRHMVEVLEQFIEKISLEELPPDESS